MLANPERPVQDDEVVSYNLARLGAAEFEVLCQALAVSVLGGTRRPIVVRNLDSRDAELETLTGSSGSSTRPNELDGPIVLIVKHISATTTNIRYDRELEEALRVQLDRLLEASHSAAEGALPPDFVIFAINAALSARPGGSIDSITTLIKSYVDRIPLKGWYIWDSNQINRYLDQIPEIRQNYFLGGDYLSQLILAEDATKLARIHLSPLAERPSGCAEVVPAWWRLVATHEAVTGLFDSIHRLQHQTAVLTPLSNGIQDLLRAAIVFTSAGLDACLEALLSHAVPLATHNNNARMKFERYLEGQVNTQKVAQAFIGALKAPDPRARLIELYILGLTSSSFQGSRSIRDRCLAALGITNEQLPDARVVSLDAFFTARNDVVHRLDLVKPQTVDARPISQPRRQEDVRRMCDEAFHLLEDLIAATAVNLSRCRQTGEG
jgi:hypothetical protein